MIIHVLMSPTIPNAILHTEILTLMSYKTEFAIFADGRCDLRVCTGNSGRGVAESFFHGTNPQRGKVEAIGAEVMEIEDGKIKEIRDYHQSVNAQAGRERKAGRGVTVAARRTFLR